MTPLHCDILIIGCGPTGVVLANLLGRLGHRVVVIERDTGIYPVPRATHIDEETLRNLQTTGLMPSILEHCAPFGKIDVVNEAGRVLFQTTVADPESVHGYAASNFFHQPSVEHVLRDGLKRYPNVSLYEGVEAERLDDHGDRVTVVAKSADRPERLVFDAAWVVGCDGGRSMVRSLLKLQMESLAPRRQWVIVDTLLKNPADSGTLPANFRYILDP